MKVSKAGLMLKSCREKKGLTQHEVACKLGYRSSQPISNAERLMRPPNPYKLEAWCEIVGADVSKVVKVMVKHYKDKLEAKVFAGCSHD